MIKDMLLFGKLDNMSIQKVLIGFGNNPDVVARALLDAPEAIRSRIFSNMTVTASAALKAEMVKLAGTSEADIEASQAQMCEAYRKMIG